MATNAKPVYKRILLKLSGEALQGSEGFGIDASILDRMAQEIKELVELGIHMGMLATVMNGLAMRDALHRAYVNARLMSAIPLNGVCDNYSWAEAISLLRNNRVVILSAGTGNPFFTTDSAACLRGIEIEADVVLKATKVDGVFTADPAKDPSATMYDQLTYSEVLDKELKVMDLAAFTLARDHKLPIRVFNMNKPGALRRVVMGEKEGTLITE
ncbi:MAG: uridine monophosphate kinase [Klebsiella michiganensis]|nr:uridine monophosphate kinase [Klebsiella michiganensis]